MFSAYPQSKAANATERAIWLDLCDPGPAELAEVEKLTGAAMPSRESLSEIESSSRLKAREDVLTMSVPMVTHIEGDAPQVAPVGFVLSRERLVTVRFAALTAFDAVAAKFADSSGRPGSSLEVFVSLCEEIVDHLADSLERSNPTIRPAQA